METKITKKKVIVVKGLMKRGIITLMRDSNILFEQNFIGSCGCYDDANQRGFDNSKTALDVGGGIYRAMEVLRHAKIIGSENGKYYSKSWEGNQYTGSRLGAFKAANQYRLAGKTVLGVSVAIGVVETINGHRMDRGKFGYNAQSAAAQTVGSLADGWAGAEAGVSFGAAIGVWFGGVGVVSER